jgi:threonine/homoserine/homoserine lactone efflux protein
VLNAPMLIDLIIFLKGMFAGIILAAPVGPVGIMCIERALAHGRIAGLAAGLGAAVADAVYGAVAAFGLNLVSSMVLDHQTPLRFVGGIFLCYIGVRTLIRSNGKASCGARAKPTDGLYGDFASTFVVTLTNPLTILAFGGVFAALGLLGAASSLDEALMLTLGVFVGSGLWWLSLSCGVGLFRHHFSPGAMSLIQRVSGGILTLTGAAILISLGM